MFKTDKAPKCYMWMGLDGSLGGVKYRAHYGGTKYSVVRVFLIICKYVVAIQSTAGIIHGPEFV